MTLHGKDFLLRPCPTLVLAMALFCELRRCITPSVFRDVRITKNEGSKDGESHADQDGYPGRAVFDRSFLIEYQTGGVSVKAKA